MAFTEYSVDSSNIDKVEYDADNLVLRVTFKNGGIYEYEGVLQEVVDEMLSASSVGGYFYSNIRMSYPYTKIR